MQRTERIVALALLAALLFNYPLLSLFAREGTILGLPLLYAYLFGAWLLVIVLSGLLHRRSRRRDNPQNHRDDRHV